MHLISIFTVKAPASDQVFAAIKKVASGWRVSHVGAVEFLSQSTQFRQQFIRLIGSNPPLRDWRISKLQS
jgi:hypothetical protein